MCVCVCVCVCVCACAGVFTNYLKMFLWTHLVIYLSHYMSINKLINTTLLAALSLIIFAQ